MSLPFGPGRPYFQVLASVGGAVTKTVYLPPPNKGYGEVEWIKEYHAEWKTLDRGNRERVAGYVPRLLLKWEVYNDVNGKGLVLGSADGNQLRIQDLMEVLATPSGRLRVCPGPPASGDAAVGFVCLVKRLPKWKLVSLRLCGSVEVELLGRDILATPLLPALP